MAEKVQKCVEDCVEYRIFPPIPEYVDAQNEQNYLEQQLDRYLVLLSDTLIEYIWQNEPFQLRVIPGTGTTPSHLYGSSKFGDNIEDEWFIVYILKMLTKQNKGVITQIFDNDGEFLLIEAAEDLPKWLNPDTSENRIFLFHGEMHIIPKKHQVDILTEAIKLIRESPQETKASAKIQRHIGKRIKGYPSKAKEMVHYSNCYIPAPLAAVLQHQPRLVAPIVQAFYFRDPIDLKACVTFQHFRPGTRVMRRLKFTRCLYSQLIQQQFQADRRSGYTIPPSSHPQYKEQDLGTKLAHGAEILCSKCDYDGVVPSQHPRWQHFLTTLSEKGYFRGEMEGSAVYSKLLEDARTFFSTSTEIHNDKKYGPGEEMMHILKTVPYDMEEMRKAEQHLPTSDDDSWIELTPEHLDNMMKEAYGDAFSGTTQDLSGVPGNMKSFINKVSSHEGAEFPSDDQEDVELDTNGFIHTMQKMFDFQDDKSSSEDEMSEYGSDIDPEDELTPSASSQSNVSSSRSHDSQLASEGGEVDLKVSDYMEMMDRELAKTTIGESFMKDVKPQTSEKPVPPPRRKKKGKLSPTNNQTNGTTSKPLKPETTSNTTKQSASSTKPSVPPPPYAKAPRALSDDIDDLEEDFAPVNVDMNLVHNLLQSYGSQQGTAGPAGNLLGSMGVHLPQDGGTSEDVLD